MPSSKLPDPRLRATFRARLLRWYRRHHRQLPWRAPLKTLGDPYRVLVSEAMLQQTQVATVIPYFNRFLAAFPTLADLAGADEQQVLSLWQGLGYYRRARHLFAAARAVLRDHAGRIPDHPADLLALPGIGRYTAGAVASIAFGRREPLVDGNVARVLARVFGINHPVDQPAGREKCWQLAQSLLPTRWPGDFNQALMELGALVCLPRQPLCPKCPLKTICQALAKGKTNLWPRLNPRPKPRRVEHHILALQRADKFLFHQRPPRGLWSNMWQLPTCEQAPPSQTDIALTAWATRLLGLRITPPKLLARFQHQTSHRQIHFHLWFSAVNSRKPLPRRGRWLNPSRLPADLPLSNPQRKALAFLGPGLVDLLKK
ncbi:MAG: A/G-specific adenine glycosylase [Phycisphaeraceae bacterium]|nr:A/G-specific adenine glycosylase [Phycisphaeraceae bacterium]